MDCFFWTSDGWYCDRIGCPHSYRHRKSLSIWHSQPVPWCIGLEAESLYVALSTCCNPVFPRSISGGSSWITAVRPQTVFELGVLFFGRFVSCAGSLFFIHHIPHSELVVGCALGGPAGDLSLEGRRNHLASGRGTSKGILDVEWCGCSIAAISCGCRNRAPGVHARRNSFGVPRFGCLRLLNLFRFVSGPFE